MTSPHDDVLSCSLKQTQTTPPAYYGLQEDPPKYEPASGSNQSPAVAPEKAMDIITDAVSSPEGKGALRKAIDELGDSAFSIEVCFTNVAHGLVSTLAVASTEDQRKCILQFHADWDQYRKAYIDLLWQSRIVAGHARAVADDFAMDFIGFLKDESISLEDKREEIQGYRMKLAEDIKNSQNLARGFLDLQTKVDKFQNGIIDFLKTEQQIEERVKQLLVDIETTNQQIKRLTKQMSASAATSLALSNVAAGAAAVAIICPLFWVAAAGAAAGATLAAAYSAKKGMDARERGMIRDELSASLKKQKAELEGLKVALSGMQRVHTILGPLQSDMTLIHEKLGMFSQIWHFISADLVKIEKDIERATTTRSKFLFKKRLVAIQQIYSALCDALYQYETRVHTQPGLAVYK